METTTQEKREIAHRYLLRPEDGLYLFVNDTKFVSWVKEMTPLPDFCTDEWLSENIKSGLYAYVVEWGDGEMEQTDLAI